MTGGYAARKAVLALVPAVALATVAAHGADTVPNADDYTREQLLLFGTYHLGNVTSEAVLHYDFRQSGSHAPRIEDRVRLMVNRVAEDGTRDLSVEFLSGDHRKPFTDIQNFRSNPVIMHFLQWDSEKMSTGRRVSQHFFRHLMRQAFRTDARSEEVTVSYGGRELKGSKVFLTPLASKAGDERYTGYTGKRYEFILAEAIPGYFYSISTLIPGKDAHAEPIEAVKMTFRRLEPMKPTERKSTP